MSNSAKTARKLPRKKKGKDLPRYPVIKAYEASFKRAYAKMLGDCLAEVVSTLKSF